MRIAVYVIVVGRQQRTRLAQRGADRTVQRIDLVDMIAADHGPVVLVAAVRPDDEHRVDPRRAAKPEIVFAMIGRHVNEARAAVGCDEIAGEKRARFGEEGVQFVQWVAGDGAGKVGTLAAPHNAPKKSVALLHIDRIDVRRNEPLLKFSEKVRGNEKPALSVLFDELRREVGGLFIATQFALVAQYCRFVAVCSKLDRDVLDVLRISQRPVHGNRPGRRRPDDRVRAGQFGRVRRLDDLEGDVDLGRGDVLIFDLGLGERRLFDRRPHDGLGALVEQARGRNLQELLDDGRLGVIVHRQIGLVPGAHDAQTLELGRLHVHPLGGEVAAFLAEFDRVNLVLGLLLLAVLLLDFPLDGQAVAVPAGRVRAVIAAQRRHADGDVLQDLVERMADMDVAIRIGRTVVQDPLVAAGTLLAQPFVEARLFPAGEDIGFLLCQTGLHREVGLRQEHGVAVIGGLVVV